MERKEETVKELREYFGEKEIIKSDANLVIQADED